MLPKAKEIVEAADRKMLDSLAFLEEDLKTYRAGKANPSIFNSTDNSIVCVFKICRHQ